MATNRVKFIKIGYFSSDAVGWFRLRMLAWSRMDMISLIP